jgi:DNA-directed RNA polymerase specialized sigma24 family protein
LIFLYMEGQTGREIAVILGITPLNVRVRLNRTKDKLKYIIKTMGYEF